MRWADNAAVVAMLLIALALTAVNLGAAVTRCLFPLAVDSKVLMVQRWPEHTPGVDDVHLLVMQNGRSIHLDPELADQFQPGDALLKQAWNPNVLINGGASALPVSDALRRMMIAMPLVFAVLVAQAWFAWRSRAPGDKRSAGLPHAHPPDSRDAR